MSAAISTDTPSAILPLESGDVLDCDEFERRYEAMPQLKKAELIEGTVFITELVRFERHGAPHADLIGWLCNYEFRTPGLEAGSGATVRLDRCNILQPDAVLIKDPRRGGSTRLSDDDILVGAPELVAEVATSAASIELHQKLRVYERNRVQEYIVWRVLERQIDWFVLREDKFERLRPDADGVYRSEFYPGLWLDAKALIGYRLQQALSVLLQGIATPEHAAFVERLSQAAAGK
jgi:hypothetical protein